MYRYGVTEDGQAIPSRPTDIQNVSDWIQPGKASDRERCIQLVCYPYLKRYPFIDIHFNSGINEVTR